MSTPSSGSEPNYAQEGPTGGQPGWGPPQGQPPGYGPAPSYSAPPTGYGAAGGRPGLVTAAAIVGIVWGALGAILSLVVTLAAFGLGAALAGLIFLISLALAVGMLVGGIFVLQGKSPKLLLYVSYADIALAILSFIISLVATGGNATTGIFGIVVAAVIVGLLLQPQSKQYYASRGLSY